MLADESLCSSGLLDEIGLLPPGSRLCEGDVRCSSWCFLAFTKCWLAYLLILCPFYPLHTSRDIMISFAGKNWWNSLGACLTPRHQPLPGKAAHTSSLGRWPGRVRASQGLGPEQQDLGAALPCPSVPSHHTSLPGPHLPVLKLKKPTSENEIFVNRLPGELVKVKASLAFALCD